MRLALALLVLAIPAIAGADSPAPPRIKVAIVPGVAVNLDSARVDALSQDLAAALATALDIEAIGGLEVRRKLPPEGLPSDCFTTSGCVADVAQRLGATQLLFVVMVDATGTGAVQIDTTWVDPATGRTAARPAIDLPAVADAKPKFLAAARQLLPDAPVRPEPKTGIDGEMAPAVPRHFTPASYATAGIGIVGIGVGIAVGLNARSKYNACERSGACDQNERDSIRTRTIIADASFLAGIAGVVVTSVLFATSGKESRLIVAPSPDGVAVSAFGRF